MKLYVQNLKQGITETRDDIIPDFLPEELSEFYPDSFSVYALIDKFERDVRVKVEFSTHVRYKCDRCLETFQKEVRGSFEQIYTMGGREVTDNIEIMQLSADTKEIDISPLLREAVLLNHPIKMLCSTECKGICPNCGVDLNKDECRCGEGQIDPRWEELRKLIK